MAEPTSPAWNAVVAVTKLHVPAERPDLVARGTLVGLLTADRHARLTLISAPPGFGKTTLLTQWARAAGEDRPFAWYSLDPDDADPVRFWSCVVEALRTVHPG